MVPEPAVPGAIPASITSSVAAAVATGHPAAVAAAPVGTPPVPLVAAAERDHLALQPAQLGVHHRAARLVLDEQVEQAGAARALGAGDDVLPQRHRTVLGDHDAGVAADGVEPRAELLGVGDGGRERGELDVLGQVDDHLLPHRTAEPVGEVVHLVHDDVGEAGQGGGPRVEHVAQHLGGHDDHGGLAVERGVAGEQPHRRGTVPRHQVVVLLVAQGLDRRGVERLAPARQGEVHGELAHHRLARARRGGDQHAVPLLQRLAGLDLERVELEAEDLGEPRELGAPPALGTPVERAGHGPTIGQRVACRSARPAAPTRGPPGQARTRTAPGTTSTSSGTGPTRSPSA